MYVSSLFVEYFCSSINCFACLFCVDIVKNHCMKVKKSVKCGTIPDERESRTPKKIERINFLAENQIRNLDGVIHE